MASSGPPDALKRIANNLVLNAKTNKVRFLNVSTLVTASLVCPCRQLLEISASSDLFLTKVWMRVVPAWSAADQHNKTTTGS